MFRILPESRAPRPRRLGGTLASIATHAVLIAAALTAVSKTPSAGAHDAPPAQPPVFIPATRPTPPAPRDGATTGARTAPPERGPVIVFVDVPVIGIPPVDVETPPVPGEPTIGRAGAMGMPPGSSLADEGLGVPDGIVGERETDRPPHVVGGAVSPRYPESLRAAGVTGRVVAQFVVDTLGRAEPGSIDVVEATRPEFAEAVRAVVPRFRFSAGEAGGRKVRTRVQIPFDFTLR